MTESGLSSETRPKSKGLSFGGKVGVIAVSGFFLVAFGVVMYFNSTGILPAARRLGAARAAYESSGAPKSAAELEAMFQVPADKNAAVILHYISGDEGLNQSLELPLTGKTGEKITVRWSKFIADVERAKSMPHFRPKRDFSNPHSILFPEFRPLRGATRELLAQAVRALENGDLANAEICVNRLGVIDGWLVDQPDLMAKIIRSPGTKFDMELVGALVRVPAGQPAVGRMLKTLNALAERSLELESVAKFKAFSLSRLEDFSKGLETYISPSAMSMSPSPVAEVETTAFKYMLKSSLGRAAIDSKGYDVGREFYQEWEQSKDIERTFNACSKAFPVSDRTPLSKWLGCLIPTFGGGEFSTLHRCSIGSHLYRTARWIYKHKGDSRVNLASLTTRDLPKELQIDPLKNPIRVTRSGNELRIYSFGVDGTDNLGGAKDIGFTVPLKP